MNTYNKIYKWLDGVAKNPAAFGAQESGEELKKKKQLLSEIRKHIIGLGYGVRFLSHTSFCY
jgi:hypothetical protein